ncbi:hypothetical protein B0H14DRAFT_3752483 [Mycena olivaceomarginata]|nr:hypothetical protein B0H14DRAFT_3752483 [Mycena olivaceomarginata]
MPPPTITQTQLENVAMCLTMTTNTLQIIADSMKTPFLGAIINTTNAVLQNMQTVNKHKEDCVQLPEQIHKLLGAIITLHIKADAELPIEVLDHVGKFTEILHKIYTFVEAQQKGNRVKSFFCQGELGTLLKDCQAGLQQSFDFFHFRIEGPRALSGITEMQKDAQKKHQEVLEMIEKLSDATASERASTINRHYSGFSNSSTSISMLPPEPKIFHGRESELSDILHLFKNGIPRIAILGAGAHLGLKPSKDLTQAVLQHFSNNPPSLLILDELETLWEPASSRGDIEELLSLLTGVEHLALMANSGHSQEEVDQILSLTANMPLAISLLAHLADTEGCSNVLSRWETEKTSLISQGFDKRSNLDLSISLSLSSPRIQLLPYSQELLSLLSMLPDGLADSDLIQSKLPIDNILKCKAALKSTSLAYSDEHKRLKVLMPIREYLQQHHPPGDHLVQKVFEYFEEILKFYREYSGTQSNSKTVVQIKSYFTNIQNVLQWGLKQKQLFLSKRIYSRKLARVSGDLYTEAQIVHTQAICWNELGHYKQSLALAIMAQSLLALCGMSDSGANGDLMSIQAEVHKCKSKYSEAWKIHTKLVQISADQNSYFHAIALLNLAEVGVLMGVPQHDVRWNIDHARKMFTSQGRKSMIVSCDSTLADLYLREQDLLRAKRLFEKSLKLASEDSQIQSLGLERLGNASQWGADYSMFRWTIIFLVYSVKCKQPLQVHKALQFLGDAVLQKDEDSAITLLTVALEGFTHMDVHRSRAESRPLFERSSQAKQVQCVDERLACIGSDVLGQHKENIAHLIELNVPSGNPCDIQDEEQVELADKPHKPVVVWSRQSIVQHCRMWYTEEERSSVLVDSKYGSVVRIWGVRMKQKIGERSQECRIRVE